MTLQAGRGYAGRSYTVAGNIAGEAGRGFAVVASEVESLANQAKQATDRIGQEIASLNGISGDVVTAVTEIKEAIQNVSSAERAFPVSVEEEEGLSSSPLDLEPRAGG
jgi:methyl-accepting chemotaxis protein